MPVPNNKLVCEQTLWTIALAWPGLTSLIRVGNRTRFDQLGVLWPEVKPVRQPADSIELKLDYPGRSTPDRGGARTLCLQPNVNTTDFEWTFTANDKRIIDITQALAELRAAMVAAGTQLGIPAIVARWEESERAGKPSAKERQVVWVQRVTIKG